MSVFVVENHNNIPRPLHKAFGLLLLASSHPIAFPIHQLRSDKLSSNCSLYFPLLLVIAECRNLVIPTAYPPNSYPRYGLSDHPSKQCILRGRLPKALPDSSQNHTLFPETFILTHQSWHYHKLMNMSLVSFVKTNFQNANEIWVFGCIAEVLMVLEMGGSVIFKCTEVWEGVKNLVGVVCFARGK